MIKYLYIYFPHSLESVIYTSVYCRNFRIDLEWWRLLWKYVSCLWKWRKIAIEAIFNIDWAIKRYICLANTMHIADRSPDQFISWKAVLDGWHLFVRMPKSSVNFHLKFAYIMWMSTYASCIWFLKRIYLCTYDS